MILIFSIEHLINFQIRICHKNPVEKTTILGTSNKLFDIFIQNTNKMKLIFALQTIIMCLRVSYRYEQENVSVEK